MKWEKVKLKMLGDQIRGVSYKPRYVSEVKAEGYTAIYRANNITEVGVKTDDLVFVKNERINQKQKLQYGDILIAASSGSKHIVGRAVFISNQTDAAFGAFCKVVRPKKEVDPRYLSYFFKSPSYRRTISNLSSGANINNIRNEDVDELDVPLPPLHIQEQIADTLDKADALRRKDQELLTKYEELAQAIFYDMFGDPIKNEKGWELVELNRLIGELSAGVSVNSSDEEFDINKPCVLKTSCVYTGKFNPKQSKVIVTEEIQRAKVNPKKDSIIISRMNTNELVGVSAYVPRDYNNIYLPDRLWMTKKGELNHSVIWLSFALKTKMFMDQVGKIATGTSGSMKNIGKKEFLNLKIIYPNITSQIKFEELLSLIEPSILNIEETRNNSETLFKKILFDYFS